MSSSQAGGPKGQTAAVSTEPKARGANRSTIVAGKLKVLPDQPEPVVPQDKLRVEPPPPPKREEGEGSATAGDSDEDEGDDEAGDETEDVEVCILRTH